MRRACLLGAVGLVLVAGGCGNGSTQNPAVYGVLLSRFVPLDSATLRPIPGRGLDIGAAEGPVLSPDGSRVALRLAGIVLVADPRKPKLLARIRLEQRIDSFIRGLAWADDSHLYAVVVHAQPPLGLVYVDTVARKVLWRLPLSASATGDLYARTSHGRLFLLFPPGVPGRSGPVIVTANVSGRVRTLRLRLGGGRPIFSESLIDTPDDVVVIASSRRLALIDPGTLAVSYRRFRGATLPLAARGSAELGDGSLIGGRRIVMTITIVGASFRCFHFGPAFLVDTATGTTRLLSRAIGSAAVSGKRIVGGGPTKLCRPLKGPLSKTRITGDGVSIFDLSGRFEHHVFAGKPVTIVHVVGPRAFVATANPIGRAAQWTIIDVTTGKVVGRTQAPDLVDVVVSGQSE